jgi:GrpB-like predicted nucleotidyltransferase (UPF0157 family)
VPTDLVVSALSGGAGPRSWAIGSLGSRRFFDRMPLEDSIIISPYDPAWPRTFEAEAKRIESALGAAAMRIDHVGSTAVPGLAAKPVIDIQLSVRVLHPLEPHLLPLVALGYTHVPHPDDASYPFLHRPSDWPHSHHIHLCEAGGSEERRNLAFRDFLREDPEEAAAYADEKLRLAGEFSSSSFESRNAYAEAKSIFIEPIIERALALGYPRA